MDDLLFRNGQFFDGLRYRESTSVLVRDGRVHAVDGPDTVHPMAAADAVVIDIDGGLLMPGFFDSHMHPLVGGLERGPTWRPPGRSAPTHCARPRRTFTPGGSPAGTTP